MINDYRPAAMAGVFYPATAPELTGVVTRMLGEVKAGPAMRPKAIIAPHAGYVYSGPIAASAFAPLAAMRGSVRRVVLLGPSHHVAITGLALPGCAAFTTPLGAVPVDKGAVARVTNLPGVSINDNAHSPEHSLEVLLPFLQTVLGDFSLLPLVVGRASPEEVAAVLDRVWGGDETVIVVSSDLSHYLDYASARSGDAYTADRILGLEPVLNHQQACGATPVNGLLLAARRHHLVGKLLDLRNSGDTAGDKSRVVGYGAFAFIHAEVDALGPVVLAIARNAISGHFGYPPRPVAAHPALADPAATFVTLTKDDVLRGCIGSLEPHRSLAQDVAGNALAAAFQDPRFPPLAEMEIRRIRIEVSLLGTPETMACTDEADALARLRPGIDGVILRHGTRRATFLPQVWESLPHPRDFLSQLKLKAGLPAGFWDDTLVLARYGVRKWKEP